VENNMRLRWRIGRIIAWTLAKPLFNFKVLGQDNLKKDSAQILVANHRSNMDPFFVALASGQEVYSMAKQELFHINKFFKWLILFWNAIPLHRGAGATEAIKKCSELLSQGKTVVVFPEGSRNKYDELMQPFKPGFSYLAINNQVPVIPVAISGVREVWHGKLSGLIDKDIAGLSKPLKLKNSKGITVRFGKPISPNGRSNNHNGYEQLSMVVQKDIELLLKEAYAI